ncbi:hypothetical protein HAZT_HAZT001822 [Hyalella azteca]|uniref:Glucose-methanol-choline oxidoreductase N-terminal domain-containing protein n=1 Tax=Hyalella azteca TaxID=294128 RepID=A0A6A0HCX5_HYAAZ|nr:hypothetical protein HAZT_HAZT001822 [Hyalella azteca]
MPAPKMAGSMGPDIEPDEGAGPQISYLGYSMMAVLALSAIWITVFSASPGVMPHADPVYDFIIVGSGVAGSVVASRLTNGTGYRVLLLEAGEEEPWVSKIPLSTLMLQGSKYDWKYYSEPQEFSSFGMLGRKSFWPRGKMLGGSAQLNYNIFTLGWRLHYDRWVLQHGLTGWDSSSLMKYVKEMFCFPIEVVVDSPGVGDNLADHMNLPVYVHINSSISINPDKLISFQNFWKYFMYREGKLTQGLFTDTAIGGILTEYKNFTVTENNNLAHTAFETSVGRDTCNDEEENHDEIQDEDAFQETNTCPISSSSLEDNVVVKDMNTDENFHGEREEEVPVSLLLFNMGAVERESYAKAANLDPKVFDETYPDMRNKSREGVFLLASCMQPFSRGHVKLSHESPQHQSIQPNYLKHPSDLHCITRAFRLAERFVRTAAMQRIGAKIHYPQLHRCKTLPNARLQNANVDSSAPDVLGSSDISDEEVGCIARTLAFTGYHPIGTLKMGPSSDREAVVDLQLRVQGVDGVRVVDASVLPSHPVPAPMGIIAVFAARAADIIKEAWSPVGKIETTEPCYAGVCGEDLYQANSSSCLHYSLITSILAALAYSLPHFIARQ